MTPRRWNPAELCGPLLSDLLHRNRAHYVPVENRQVLHYVKVRHVHGALMSLVQTRFGDTASNFWSSKFSATGNVCFECVVVELLYLLASYLQLLSDPAYTDFDAMGSKILL